jgi:DivIVA domain-containing protein
MGAPCPRRAGEARGDGGRWASALRPVPSTLGIWSYSGLVADDKSSKVGEGETRSPATPEQEHGFGEVRRYVPAEILDVSFPGSVRGYERGAVDAYIKRVNRVIAELKVSASPPAAVRHALEQAEGKVQGLLEAAREAAEEITASAQREAEESTARAKAEAADLVVNTSAEADRVRAEADELIANTRTEADETLAKAKTEADQLLADARAEAQNALDRAQTEADERLQRLEEELTALQQEAETRLREIEADTEAVWKQRGQLLDDIRAMAAGLVDLADAALARSPRREPDLPKEETPQPEVENEIEPQGDATTDESVRAMPAVGSQESEDDEPRNEGAESPASEPET